MRLNKLLYAIATLLLGVTMACGSGEATPTATPVATPTPATQKIVEEWLPSAIDDFAEGVLFFVLDGLGEEGTLGRIIQELGGEWLEGRINEHLRWTIVESTPDSARIEATATFRLDRGFVQADIDVSLPFDLTIENWQVTEIIPAFGEGTLSISDSDDG